MSTQKYTTKILVGLDIGKNVHVACSYSAEALKALHEPLEMMNNRQGFEQFSRYVRQLLSTSEQVVLGNEPTGIYYEAFGREIQREFGAEIASGQLVYHLVNPHLVKLSRQALQNGRHRKTDPIDTQAIARCLQLGQVLPVHFADGQALQFEQWAIRYRRSEREKRQLRNDILSQLDRLWPGAFVNLNRFKKAHPDLDLPVPLVETRPLERKLVQALLTHCPNPHHVLAFTETEMLAFLREYVGRSGLETARKVLRNARQALLPPPEAAQVYVMSLQTDWQRYLQLECLQAQLVAQADVLVPHSPAAVLLTVPGISTYHAARYLAMVGDVQRFPSAEHLWAFAGLDPALAQSGDSHRLGKISKQGDPAFRDALYLIGQSTSQHCPPIRAAFDRCYRHDRRRRVLATLHAAHKANRLLYHLLFFQEPYDPCQHR